MKRLPWTVFDCTRPFETNPKSDVEPPTNTKYSILALIEALMMAKYTSAQVPNRCSTLLVISPYIDKSSKGGACFGSCKCQPTFEF